MGGWILQNFVEAENPESKLDLFLQKTDRMAFLSDPGIPGGQFCN